MDRRLRAAVDASVCWYEDLFALHGVAHRTADGLWWALGPPPPLHSAAKSVQPWATSELTLCRVAAYPQCSVADSFGALVLPGFDLLFEARWLYREPLGKLPAPLPTGWSPVHTSEELAEWTARFAPVQHVVDLTTLARTRRDVVATPRNRIPIARMTHQHRHTCRTVDLGGRRWSLTGGMSGYVCPLDNRKLDGTGCDRGGSYRAGLYSEPCALRSDSIHSAPLSKRVVFADLTAPPAATASANAAATVSSDASYTTSTSYSPNG
jgi:hypothetical protein